MMTTNQYDYLNRLSSIASAGTGSTLPPVSFTYAYNPTSQRTDAPVQQQRFVYDRKAIRLIRNLTIAATQTTGNQNPRASVWSASASATL